MDDILARQIERFLPNISEQEKQRLLPFFSAVSKTYAEHTEDRRLMERSLEITSREMYERNQRLRKEVDANSEAVASLKQTLATLQPRVFETDAMSQAGNGEELVRLANYLRSMVITNRQALEQLEAQEIKAEALSRELEQFKIAVDSTADYVAMLDTDLRIVYANASVKSRTGYTAAEGKVIHEQWWSRVDHTEVDRIRTMLLDPTSKQSQFSYEVKASAVDGEEFLLAVHSTVIRNLDGSVRLILDISRDISKERSLEKLKDEFVSIASHELRTPMTVIRGYARILASEKAGTLTADQKDYLHRIIKNTQMLIELVGDMLSLGKLEANRLSFVIQPLSIATAITGSVEKFSDMYKEKSIHLMHDVDSLEVMADPDRIDQVLTNLLSNAFKFTPSGGTVGLFAQQYAHDPAFVVVAVEDTGIGIPQNARDSLFKKFSQVDNVLQRQAGGTGLGLAICKQIVERLGGKIWVEDRKAGHGTRFCFTLPKVPVNAVGYNQTQPTGEPNNADQ